MSEHLKKATSLALATNVFLFAIKLTVGIISNSITMISEAVNSSTDIISSLAIKYSVRISSMKPDDKHQFGHSAAQPIATFIVAVFAGVLGLNIIQESVKRIITPANIQINLYVYIVLAITIISKVILNRYQI
ncbi:MAG: cation diffusion facilitator family transporter, partial [Clostridiales bacterium]